MTNAQSRWITHAALISVLCLLSACGDPGPGGESPAAESAQPPEKAATAPAGDACRLLTRAEAEAVLGAPLKEPASYGATCRFESVDFQNDPRRLEIHVEELADPAARAAQLREMWQPVEDVSGIGDRAFFASRQLFVYSGDYQLMVTVGLPMKRPAEVRELAGTVAKSALPRLGSP